MKSNFKLCLAVAFASTAIYAQTLKATVSGSIITNTTAGGNSTFVGSSAGNAATGGSNTFLGSQSGNLNTTGNQNTFVGEVSGASNVTGTSNVYLGNGAGYYATNSSNTFVGSVAGYSTTSGYQNSFLGHGSGNSNVTGTGNTYLGFFAGGSSTGSNNVFVGTNAGQNETGSNLLYIHNTSTANPLLWGNFDNTNRQLKIHGKVGIGGSNTTNFGSFPTTASSVNVSNYTLFVKGGILTEEVRVAGLSNWADYVFEKNYDLKPLSDVEKFISENGHLPNVPSAKQIKEEGFELSNMAKIQQEKIEELTLYLIQQQKEIEELKAVVKTLINK